MFRDESTKVIQKAHAQWGVLEMGEASGVSVSTPTSAGPSGSESWPSASSSESLTGEALTCNSLAPSSAVSTDSIGSVWGDSPVPISLRRRSTHPESRITTKMPREVATPESDQGIHFYIQHYIIGHPDEARDLQDLKEIKWLHKPNVSEMMAAVGLASLSNLTGRKELDTIAQQKYGLALQHIAKALQNLATDDQQALMRSVVMLAMFEVVRGNQDPTGSARTHIMGAAALAKSLAPWAGASEAFRSLIQLCFSMVPSVLCSVMQKSAEPVVLIPTQFVPCYVAGLSLPDAFFDMITNSEAAAPPCDRPAAQLIFTVTRFVQLVSFMRGHAMEDEAPATDNAVREMFKIELDLSDWERKQLLGDVADADADVEPNIWTFKEVLEPPDDPFPPAAVFHGKIHAYTSMWTARVWNHYRWARLMTNQLIVEASDRFPSSMAAVLCAPDAIVGVNAGVTPEAVRMQTLATTHRISAEMLTSLPTHWRHPGMQRRHRDRVEESTAGGAGIGAAGIPTLLFQVKCAACVPGVPRGHWKWALQILETIWADTGMLQARALADITRAHGASLEKGERPAYPVIKREEVYR